MIITSVELKNFRNYKEIAIIPDKGINIFCGNNAQGKTNILEAVYTACTSKSQKGAKDRELIMFGENEAHIKLGLNKKDINYRIDIHIKKNKAKGIAVNGIPIKRVSELFGLSKTVVFSPEDMGLIKNSPSERRRFLDIELCQLSRIYVYNLISYNKVIDQKNKILKDAAHSWEYRSFIDVYNEQLLKYGTELIRIRAGFIEKLDMIIRSIHKDMTAGKEDISLIYEANVRAEDFERELLRVRDSEIRNGVSLAGPHRDDISFIVNNTDLRHFGSQGQQRTAVLSLKLSEIEIIKEIAGDDPVLLLDDVLSELDTGRQNRLLSSIGNIQTMITCTGLDDFVNNRFHMDRVFRVSDGNISIMQQ